MAKVKDEKQIAMQDRFIEDPELVEQIEIYMENKSAAKEFATAKKKINGRLDLVPDKEDGQTIRCGPYTMTIKARGGGGFEVPHWDRLIVGGIGDASD